MKRKHIRLLAVGFVAVALVIWRTGIFDVVDRITSPDGSIRVTVSEHTTSYKENDRIPTVTTQLSGRYSGTTHYLNTTYQGLWWSPDSTKYLVDLVHTRGEGFSMELVDLEGNSSSNFGYFVASAMRRTPLADYGLRLDQTDTPIVELTFSQWSEDSDATQFYYSFTDTSGASHSGSVWYSLSHDNIAEIQEET